MTVTEAIAWGKLKLSDAEKDDAAIAPSIFLEKILECSNAQLYLNNNVELNVQQEETYKNYITQRAQAKPLAYIIGEKEFYGLMFKVNEHVLIPRPETELIVDEVLRLNTKGYDFKKIMDVGTGSGVLAITLKHYLKNSEVSAIDISADALNVAQSNAQKHAVEIEWFISDLLHELKDSYDLIVANLPYIPWQDQSKLSQEVLQEPEKALFAEQEGLALYEELIEQAKQHLTAQGMMICEFGINQSQAVHKVFEQNDFTVLNCIKDLSEIDRVIIAQKR
ncbi:peptide chain release factor N(5)-glutamine methyltransferase [bacterium]|nr:peptide chain release factor N(5)-glutamine methyltransferase [bacterium]